MKINWKTEKLINPIFTSLIRQGEMINQGFLESYFNSLHAWTTDFHIFNINFTKFENYVMKKLNIASPAWLLDAVGKFMNRNWYLNSQIKQKNFWKYLPHQNEISNNSKIQNKMHLWLMAKQGILWHRSNVIVLLALSHRINLSHLNNCYQKQHTHVTGSLSDYNVLFNLGSLRNCRSRNYMTTIRILFENHSKGFNSNRLLN